MTATMATQDARKITEKENFDFILLKLVLWAAPHLYIRVSSATLAWKEEEQTSKHQSSQEQEGGGGKGKTFKPGSL